MNRIAIVIQREYSTRVRKKSFLLLTFLMPALFLGLIFGAYFLSSVKDDKVKPVVVADETGKYFSVLKDFDQYRFIKAEGGFEKYREKSDNEVYATLLISGDLLENPSAITMYSRVQVTPDLIQAVKTQLNKLLRDQKLESYNIPNIQNIIKDSQISIDLQTIKWDNSGNEKVSSAGVASVVGSLFTVIIYMFILVYGAMVMQGVQEEKTSRIIEVMVSSVKPFDLMMGKIIGIGLVGLTQFFLWGTLFVVFKTFGSSIMQFQGMESMQQLFAMISSVDWLTVTCCFILFFIGGFMIFASIFAAIGAMVNSPEDTQQFMMPVTLLIVFALYAGIYSAGNPDGPLAFWASMFPLTSPIVMMTRIPFGVPAWQIALSASFLFVTVILMVKLTAKIYRVGILMYGKKPDIKELIKWLKY